MQQIFQLKSLKNFKNKNPNKKKNIFTSQNANYLFVGPPIVRQRILIPKYKFGSYNKTIVSVLDYSNGIGDFLRGSILLAQYANHYNINFKMDVSKHNIFEYLDIEPDVLFTPPNKNSEVELNTLPHNFVNIDSSIINSHIINFINSDKEIDYITTNWYYNFEFLTENIKSYINSIFKFKQKYYDISKKLFNLDKYAVLHIRCSDEHFDTEFEDNNLLLTIMKLQLPPNTIVMSNNYSLKIKLNARFGFYFIDKPSVHTANKEIDYNKLESTVIDYIILSKSSYTYCISYYGHGSGFSEHCSVLNNVPYSVICLPLNNIVKLPVVIENNLNLHP
jgi:hypothetical protein